jgi:hypothetical protein
MCFVVIVLGWLVFFLFVNMSIKTTLAYKSTADSYFEYVLVSFCFKDVSIFVGSIFDPDRLHFDEVKAFLVGLGVAQCWSEGILF